MSGDPGTSKMILFCLVELAIILSGVLAIWLGLRRKQWRVRLGLLVVGTSVLLLIPQYKLFTDCLESFGKSFSEFGSEMTLAIILTAAATLLPIVVLGLLIIWAALGRGHWFVRTGLMVALLGLLLAVPAYEVLLILLPQLLVAGVPLAFVRRLRDRNEGQAFWQFSIRDLLLFTFICAALLGIGASIPSSTWLLWERDALFPDIRFQPDVMPWIYYLILGIEAGLFTLLALWIVFGKCRRWKRLTVLFVLIPAVYAVAGWLLLKKTTIWSGSNNYYVFDVPDSWSKGISLDELTVLLVPATFVLMVLWLALLCGSRFTRAKSHSDETPTTIGRWAWLRWIFRTVLVIFSLLLMITLGTTYWILASYEPIPEVELPEPNGYTRLVALSRETETLDMSYMIRLVRNDPKKTKPQEFYTFIQQNEKLLSETKAAIDLPSCVPLTYSFSDIHSLDNIDYYFWNLGHVTITAGHACCHQGDYDGGVKWYVDTIRLGRKFNHGGLWYSSWVIGGCWYEGGMFATELMALYAIHESRRKMPQKIRQEIVKTLQDLGEEGEPFQTVLHRDRIWRQHALGWAHRIEIGLEPPPNVDTDWSDWRLRTGALIRARHRLLLINLALENYRNDHGHYPNKLEKLVPDYLDQLPCDPFGGGLFCYRVTGKGYRVYSVGDNGKDDGGLSKKERGDEVIVDDLWYYD